MHMNAVALERALVLPFFARPEGQKVKYPDPGVNLMINPFKSKKRRRTRRRGGRSPKKTENDVNDVKGGTPGKLNF